MKNILGILLFCVATVSLYGTEGDENVFRWAADIEGGVPSVFQDPTDPKGITGFEKEIADAIAKEMGMKSEFYNNGWDGLVPGLKRGLYDAVVDALVITPKREKIVSFSIPYYISYLQLVVLDSNEDIHSLDDCKDYVVGTLRGSRAAEVLRENNIDSRVHTTELNSFSDLKYGRVDAVLIDAPVAIYYAGIHDEFKFVGPAVDWIEYGVAVRQENQALLNAINVAITKLKVSGKLREILDRWNLWNDYMANYLHDFSVTNAPPTAFNAFVAHQQPLDSWKSNLSRYLSFLPQLGKGALMTVQISLISMAIAILLGLLLAICNIYGPMPLSFLAKLYIEIIRGTPLLIQLYFIFYGLPSIGIRFNPFAAGTLALALNYAAYEAENYRAGILAIPHGQMEAARALGMTHAQALRYVVIPQAFRVVLPPVTNDFISLLKDSSLVSVITIIDLTFTYSLLATTYYNYFGIGIIVALIYLCLGLPFVFLARWAERELSDKKRGR